MEAKLFPFHLRDPSAALGMTMQKMQLQSYFLFTWVTLRLVRCGGLSQGDNARSNYFLFT